MKKKTLKELQGERELLKKQQDKIQTEIDKIVRTVSMKEYKGRYENTYWKTICDGKKKFYRYYHVITIKEIWEIDGAIRCLAICNTFETQLSGIIICDTNEVHYTHAMETKITASEYNKAKSALLKKLSEN